VASCRGTPTVSDLVATHGSGLRRYVLVEGPNAQLVRPGRAWYTVSEVDRDAILLLTRHAPSTTHRGTFVRDRQDVRHLTGPSSPGSSRVQPALFR
jgi:hypothetical protein